MSMKDMKAQMSLEFLLYSALAGLSILFALSMLNARSKQISSSIAGYEMQSLMDSLNSAILSGKYVSYINAYIPIGACNSTVSSGKISNMFGNFYTYAQLDNASFLCPDGMVAYMEVRDYGSSMQVVRVMQ